MLFISPAYAQDVADAAAVAEPSFLMSIAPLVLVFIVFYLLVIRPQNKRVIEHRKTVNTLQRGDTVVTGGGIIAKVKKMVGDDEVIVDIGSGIEVKILRHTIMTRREPGNQK